ncbi:MAG: hypothetical protein LBI45_08440 [Bacteroidales bacterium]|jgi:hypothetical protein|nr:hypothetical protein [Bacteroidales bacterium]
MKKINQTISYCLIIIFFLSCSNKSKEDKILEKVALSYYKEFQTHISDVKEYAKESQSLLQPVIIEVIEKPVFEGKKNYTIFHHNFGIYEDNLPTRLFKRKDFYIVMYLKDQPSMSLKDIPASLIHNCDAYAWLGESSWEILICPNTYQFIVVHIFEAVPNECVKQLREFICDKKKQRFIGKIEVKKWIVDREILLPPPPFKIDSIQ